MNRLRFITTFILFATIFFCPKMQAQYVDPYWDDLKSTCKDCDTTYLFTTTLDDSLFVAQKGSKYGIINYFNNVILPFDYDYIGHQLFDRSTQSLTHPHRKDTVNAHLVIKQGKCGLMDRNLKLIVPIEYDSITGAQRTSHYIEDKLILKKAGKSYLYDYINNYLSRYAYDSIRFYTDKSVHWLLQKEVTIAGLDGKMYLLDSTGRIYYDFNHLKVERAGNYDVILDTALNKVPVNICPLASIDQVDELNTAEHYAIVSCLKKTFVINKYGEMSIPFASYPEVYHAKEQLVFTRKNKGGAVALFDMKGNEVGKLSKYKLAYPDYDMKTNECYYRFQDSKKRVGLMNMKGELLLECKYADLGTISDGKCLVWKTSKEQEEVDLKSLKPKAW